MTASTQSSRRRARPAPPTVACETPAQVPIAGGCDHAGATTAPGGMGRLVQIFTAMDPVAAATVDSMQARLRDGSDTSTSSDLSGPLGDLLGDLAAHT